MQAPPKRWKKRQQLKPDVISELQVALADLRITRARPLAEQVALSGANPRQPVLPDEHPGPLQHLQRPNSRSPGRLEWGMG